MSKIITYKFEQHILTYFHEILRVPEFMKYTRRKMLKYSQLRTSKILCRLITLPNQIITLHSLNLTCKNVWEKSNL